MEKESERIILSLKNTTKRTPTLAEQYSRFIPTQVSLNPFSSGMQWPSWTHIQFLVVLVVGTKTK